MTRPASLSVPPTTPPTTPPATPPRRGVGGLGTVLLCLVGLLLLGGAFMVRRMLLMPARRCAAFAWHGCFDTFNGVVLMTLVLLPVAVLVAWALARRRRAAGVPGAWRTSLAEVGMVHGTVPFLWLTMMPGAMAGQVPGRFSLVPLRDLATMGALGIVGNLLVFASLGFFAPLRFAAMASAARVLALGAGCSVLVEILQYVLRLDRVSSVDDVLVNTAGALLAGLASRRWWLRAEGS
ncbi:VanZ family protein [Streptomyces sp. NBC_00102]|uniref:VanZ family protein n=1 Tax=Streptomyces sp. NBC_00102 TaxID=2975652 RepID=UPI00225451C7|nr:VanZ family protein [Streptomyces sp. NBC_00102]MCX5399129.1 VanZ family protein [Streptomyces sp. NBC_00102]